MRHKLRQVALRASLVYGIAAALWILASDWLLGVLVSDPVVMSHVAIFKGWAFVGVTAALLYVALRRQLGRFELEAAARERAEERLRDEALFPEEDPFPVLRVSREGALLYANRASAALLDQWRCRVEAPAPGFVQRAAAAALAIGETHELETPCGERDLSFILVPIREREYVNLYGRDITERKQAAGALRQSEERYRRIVEIANEGVWTVDSEFRTTFVNQHLADMLGYVPEEMIGRKVDEFTVEEELADHRDKTERRRRGLSDPPYERRFRRKDGPVITTITSTTPVMAPDGRFLGAVGMLTDMSGLQRVEEERRSLEAQLQQSLKLEAIGQLAGGVAHDFNNLLTVILGYSDVMLAEMDPDDGLRGCVVDIRNAGERAATLTRQLLAFSRRQVLTPKILDLNDVVGGVEKMLRRLIGEDIVLTTILPPLINKVRVDPGQMEQAIVNLAVNARDAMPEGGRLTIETRDCLLDEEFCRVHSGIAPGRYVGISVADTGCGMAPDVQSRIFEPFFTTKGPGKGTGLGLATVFGIVKQSDGYIDVESEAERGTCFTIYLPAVEVDSSEAPADKSPSSPPLGDETILLVEDEDEVRRIARLSLETHGYRVVEASSGSVALALVEEMDAPFHLLVTDVVMPEMNGRQLAEALQVRFPGLKTLFVSGYTDDKIVQHGVTDAGVNYLQKPFSPRGLARKVRDILDGR